MVFPVGPSDQEAKRRMAVNGYSTVKESEAAAIDNKDDDNLFFFDARGIVHHEFVPQEQTVNEEVYISVLKRMREAIRRRRPDLWASGQWTLLHDNARPHTALNVSRFLNKHNVTVLPHPPYSPDLSPRDLFLFPRLKKRLNGRRHENIEAIQAAATMELTGIPKRHSPAAFGTCRNAGNSVLTAEGTTSKGTGSITCEVEFCIYYRLSLRTLRTKDVLINVALS